MDRLGEAIEFTEDWLGEEFVLSVSVTDRLFVILDAARAYADLLANGERVTWCETHFDTWTTVGACRNGIAEGESHRCVKVDRLLIDPPKEEE